MKTLFVAFLLLCSYSHACSQLEAQFIGKAQNVVNCSYQISFTHYNMSMVCPLDIDEVLNTRLTDPQCSIKEGQTVSGVLVKKDDSIFID